MSGFWLSLLLAFGATLDSLLVGFHYGVKGIRISRMSNLVLSMWCFAGTFFAMLGGVRLADILSPALSSLIGALVLLVMGVFLLLSGGEQLSDRSPASPERADKDLSRVIEVRESFFIGLLLSLNNLGLGLGAGMGGLSPVLTPVLCGIFSFLFIQAGFAVGRQWCVAGFGRFLCPLSGVLVLLLGGLELFGAL